jgi:hypothetical protein
MFEKETIHIAWPTSGTIDNYFAVSILDIAKTYPEKIHSWNSIEGIGLLSKSRNLIVKHFLDNTDADWLFMTDSDQFVPVEAFTKLMNSADKDKRPILSGLVFGNRGAADVELSPCIYVTKEHEGQHIVQAYEDYPENQIVSVYAAGTGCLLIHRSALEAIRKQNKESLGASWAWFQDGPIGDDIWLSEDLMFSEYARKSGFTIYAHTGAIIPHHKKVWLTQSQYKAQQQQQAQP